MSARNSILRWTDYCILLYCKCRSMYGTEIEPDSARTQPPWCGRHRGWSIRFKLDHLQGHTDYHSGKVYSGLDWRRYSIIMAWTTVRTLVILHSSKNSVRHLKRKESLKWHKQTSINKIHLLNVSQYFLFWVTVSDKWWSCCLT